MTLILQKVLLFALLVTGAALVTGLLWNNGPLLVFGTYFGWFAAAVSIASYFMLLVLLIIRGTLPSWGRVCSVNMGLALVGISILGFDGQMNLLLLSIGAVVAIAFAVVVARLNFFANRSSALLIIAIVAVTALRPLQPFWPQILLVLGLILIAGQLLPFARHD